MMKKAFASLTLLCCLLMVKAQATEAERKYTAFDMRSNGKIYVVVTVMLIILIGLLLYLFRLDRKITKMEKQAK
jgi:K+-transporting ATPase A subunit